MKIQLGPFTLLNECIIVATKDADGDIILAKNRDRTYEPNIKIIHTIKDGVEIAYWYDVDTGWAEGLNEYGIGVVNTALMVGFDEKEKKIAKKTGIKSKDGKRIIAALSKKNINDVLKEAKLHTGGIKGHTIIADAKGNIFTIESTRNHKAVVKKVSLDQEGVIVRTNHGIEYKDAGYTKGKDKESSIKRMEQAQKLIFSKTHTIEEILDILKMQNYEKNSHLNMRRDTSEMKTTSQIGLDLTNKKMVVHWFQSKSNLIGIESNLPKDHKPKIKIVVKKVSI